MCGQCPQCKYKHTKNPNRKENTMADLSADDALFDVTKRLSEAKRVEAEAKEARIAVEAEMIALVGFKKAKGSEGFAYRGNRGASKFTLTQPSSRSIVEDRIPALKKILVAAQRGLFGKLFTVKHSLDAKAYAALKKENGDLYLEVAKALIEKPGKIGVKLDSIEAVSNE